MFEKHVPAGTPGLQKTPQENDHAHLQTVNTSPEQFCHELASSDALPEAVVVVVLVAAIVVVVQVLVVRVVIVVLPVVVVVVASKSSGRIGSRGSS